MSGIRWLLSSGSVRGQASRAVLVHVLMWYTGFLWRVEKMYKI